MAKATIAKLRYGTQTYGMNFETADGISFVVTKLDNGILHLEQGLDTTIHEMAEIVAGCFEPRSSFLNVKEVIFTFNRKKVSVKKEENATPEMIYKKWYNAPYDE
jgi:hypothetical protein